MKATTASQATWDDRFGEYDHLIYDLDKCLSIPEKIFIAHFPSKHKWDDRYNLISKSRATYGKTLERRDKSGYKVVSVCVRSAVYRKSGNKILRPGGIIRVVRIHRMVFSMTYGPIPPNCYVGFIDDNIENCHPDNLELRYMKTREPVPTDLYEGSAIAPKDIDLGPVLGYDNLDNLQNYLSTQF